MQKFVANTVFGVALSSALVAGISGCATDSSANPDIGTDGAPVESFQRPNEMKGGDGVTDPGVRGGDPGAGGPIAGMNANELALFNEGAFRMTEVEATCDDCSDITPGTPIPAGSPPDTTNSAGLGARFNSNITCTTSCHAQPALGGTSGFVNQSFTAAHAKGATNVVPFFETMDGPTREVRFLFNPDGTRDGGVHQKFSTRGRSDAPACTLGQPDFEANRGNMGFRIPTPLFGLGIIDSLPDVEILAHASQDSDRKASLGIHGHPNHNPNTGTIARFGWKAQNASITLFAGEAYTVEVGVTNELFPISKVEDYNCNLGAEPNDVLRTGTAPNENFSNPLTHDADWMTFQFMMRFLDAPKPAPLSASAQSGQQAFNDVGCNMCHTPSMTTRSGETGPNSDALKGVTANLYSDLLLHHMGATLADNVIQGEAGPDEFRSSPLWGVGQRIFFLHDGRTKSLVDAILAHFSQASPAHGNTPAYPASEANQVVKNFLALPRAKQQDLVNFLRSL